MYLAAHLVYHPIRENTLWLAPRRVSSADVLWAAGAVWLSTGAGLWAGGGPPDPGSFARALPRFSNPLLLADGITAFALLNGTGEEVMFRGIYRDGPASLFRSPCAVVHTRKLFFGLCRFRGFPSGFIGIVMGLIRLRTGGTSNSGPLTTPRNLLN